MWLGNGVSRGARGGREDAENRNSTGFAFLRVPRVPRVRLPSTRLVLDRHAAEHRGRLHHPRRASRPAPTTVVSEPA
jgi:hypothetical protein